MRLFPNARDEHLNGKENLRRAYMFRCVRLVKACLTWCNEKVVHFSRCRTSLGDFQRVFLTRSPHRLASLALVRCAEVVESVAIRVPKDHQVLG